MSWTVLRTLDAVPAPERPDLLASPVAAAIAALGDDASRTVVVGSGIRGSKLAVPGAVLAALPYAETVPDLAR